MRVYNNSVVLRNDGVDPSTSNADLNAALGVNVTVRVASTPIAGLGVLASIFNIADVAIANPMQTDDKGNYQFKVVDGVYDVVIAEGTADEQILSSEEIVELDVAANINDLSLPYIFDTVAEYKAFTIAFPIGKVIYLKDRGMGSFKCVTGETADEKSIIQNSTLSFQIKLFNAAIVRVSFFGMTNVISNLDDAISYAKATGSKKVICDIPEIRVSDPAKSQGTYSTYETWNFSSNIDAFDGEIDMSMTTLYVDSWATSDTRITVFTVTNCTGEIRLPKVEGQLPTHTMGSSYVDDCFVRIGGGCKNLTVHNTRLIKDYPGHGILVRHYTEDTGAADLSTNVPVGIDIKGRGGVIGSWQSNVVTVTGYDIVVTVNATYAGNSITANSQQSSTGHGVHFEAVTNGTIDPYSNNQKAIACNTTHNRLNGLMFHTAIRNYQSLNNYSAFNQQYGGEYQAFCDGLFCTGNVYEYNVQGGVLAALSTATWLGSETKASNVSFNDSIQHNTGIGFEDLSHGVNLKLSGTIKRCTLGGYVSADGTDRNRNTLSDLTISDCGKNQATLIYAAIVTTEIMSNVKIINSDSSVYRQIPFRFKTGRTKMGANITIIGDSPNDSDFVADFDQPSRLPLVDTSVRLRGDLATISNGHAKIQDKSSGEFLIPTGFLSVSVSNTSGQFPSYKLTEAATLDLLGTEFIIYNDGDASASLSLRDGLLNGSSSFSLVAASSYRIRYTSLNNATVTLI
jgi:hypothetical protein